MPPHRFRVKLALDMATIEDVLKQIERDPVIGFVSIPIAATRNRPTVKIKVKGRTLVLPDWNAREWLWWGRLALAIAQSQDAKNEAGRRDKETAAKRFAGPFNAMELLGTADDEETPPIERVFPYYDAAVRLVIASHAAARGETRGRLAAEAFGRALIEAPQTIVIALKDVFESAGSLFLKELPRAALDTLKGLFEDATGIELPSTSQIGTIAIVAVGAWVAWQFFNRRHKGE